MTFRYVYNYHIKYGTYCWLHYMFHFSEPTNRPRSKTCCFILDGDLGRDKLADTLRQSNLIINRLLHLQHILFPCYTVQILLSF